MTRTPEAKWPGWIVAALVIAVTTILWIGIGLIAHEILF